MNKLFGAAFVVAIVYLVSVLVIWLLSLIGPISATVQGVLNKGGSTIWFAAAGLAGLFIIISAVALAFVYAVAKRVTILTQAVRNLGVYLSGL